MPSRSRKPRSTTKAYETVPNIKQAYLKAPKRTIRETQPAWSAPSKYQQTITQMNPFRAIYHPDSEREALETDEEEEPTYVASPVGRKRRRITPNEPEKPPARMLKTRSSARKAIGTESQSQESDGDLKLPRRRGSRRLSKPQTPATLMPPPVTPRTWRKREIPSSQSPADSPLSTQKGKSSRIYSRSPLKERSTNIILPATSTKRSGLWAKKLQVEDSMENEEEDSPTLIRPRPRTEPSVPNIMPQDLVEDDNPLLPTNETGIGWKSSGEVPESSQRQNPEANLTSPIEAAKALEEIIDSDLEYDDEDAENESLELVHDYAPLSREPKTSGQLSELNSPHTADPTPKPPKAQSRSDSPLALYHNAEDDVITPLQPRSQSEEASAQLSNDLQRATQPGGLQTESQYENAWDSYHPDNASNDHLDENENMPSSPPLETEESDSMPAPMTVPTQNLSPAAKTPFKRLVPPSQATTTDVTQPSPRKMPSSSSLAFPSSPPPMPPPLSSPLGSRKAVDPWVGFQWDGVRLTDSQLLPESLMNDSYIGPPGGSDLSQEGLEE